MLPETSALETLYVLNKSEFYKLIEILYIKDECFYFSDHFLLLENMESKNYN